MSKRRDVLWVFVLGLFAPVLGVLRVCNRLHSAGCGLQGKCLVCVWRHAFMYLHPHGAGVYMCIVYAHTAAVAAVRGVLVAAAQCLPA